MKKFKQLREQLLTEGYSKRMTEKEVAAIEKKYGRKMDDLERVDYLNKKWSPSKIARGESWLAISYPVKDGEYYFALMGNEKQATHWNDIMNKKLKSLAKTHNGDPDALYDVFMDWAESDVPSRAGVGDTMTREEIWGACLHILRKKVVTMMVDESVESVEEGFFKNLLKRIKRGIRISKPRSKPKKIREQLIKEASATITVQVKGFKGNLKAYDRERMNNSDFDLGGLLGIDRDSADPVKYGRDTVTYSFPDFNLDDAEDMFKTAVKTAKDMTNYSKYTASMFKKLPDEDPSDWPGNTPIDDFYVGAYYDKNVTPGKPFVYTVKFNQLKEDVNERAYTRDEKLVQQAVGIAMNMGGNMTGAYKKIEKLKRGLGDHPVVKAALRLANESVEEAVISELTMKQIRRKHSAPLRKAMRSGNLELPQDAEEALYQWAFDNGEIKTDDPDEFTDWLDNNLDDIVRGKLD